MNYLCFNQLLYKLIDDSCLDNNGKIREEIKYSINNSKFNIQNSKFIGKMGDKFETLLFLPPNPNRIAEGGLRTKGLFKVNYKLGIMDDKLNTNNSTFNIQHSKLKEIWRICNLDGNPVVPAPDDIQNKINNYMSQFQNGTPQFNIQHSTFNINFKLPLITVITVVFNGAKYLEDTIKSVISQTYPNIEYIIIDGGSTDGTLDVIKKYEDYIDYWVSEPDNGIYDAMNKGLELAGGEWINFMNCGDSFYSNNILNEITDILQRDDIDFIYGDMLVEYIEEKKFEALIKAGDYRNLYLGIQFCHQSSLIKTRVHKRIKYRLDVFASDYAFFYECFLSGCKFFKVDKVISKFQSSGFSEKNELKSLCSTFSWSFNNTVNIFKKMFIFLNFTFKLIYIILKKPVKKILPLKIRKGITYLKARLINLLRC